MSTEDKLRRALDAGRFMMIEPYLSSWRLIIGFESLPDAQAAQDAIIALKSEALAATQEQPAHFDGEQALAEFLAQHKGGK